MSVALAIASTTAAEPPLSADSDEALMARIAAGDEQAFEGLLSRHLDRIHHYLRRLTGREADSDDLAQETFIRVWLKARSFRPGRVRVTTWLHRIAHNVAVDHLRKAGRATRLKATEPPSDEAGPVALRQQAEERRDALRPVLRSQMRALGPRFRHLRGAQRDLIESAAAEPFDRGALEGALARFRTELLASQERSHSAFVEVMAALSADERKRVLESMRRRGPPRHR